MSTTVSTCPIWGTPAQLIASGDGVKVQSNRAGGEYRISGTAMSMVDGLTPAEKAHLTTWLIDQRRFGEPVPMVTSDEVRRAKTRAGLRMSDRKDRFFIALSGLNIGVDFRMKFRGQVDAEYQLNIDFLMSWLEFSRSGELSPFLHLLMNEALVEDSSGCIVLTPAGWNRLEAAERGNVDSLQAFCAMWFDPSMDDAFANGFVPAIEAAGYRPARIDRKEHVNKIDDEIISEIRRSRFIVADATCGVTHADGKPISIARGGVYYEAGFAFGLSLPVIWTCREDCMPYVHFDTRQFAHIVWTTPEDLRAKLFNRIGHVIGFGPNAKEAASS